MLKSLYNRIYENPKYLPTGIVIGGGLLILICVIGAYVYLSKQGPEPNPNPPAAPAAVEEPQPMPAAPPQTLPGGPSGVALPEDPQ